MTKPRAVFLDALSLGPVDLAPLERHAELICWPSTPPELRLERLQGPRSQSPTRSSWMGSCCGNCPSCG